MINELILKKEYCNNIVTKYGSYDTNTKPKVIYLRTKAKITPTINKTSFEEGIINVKNNFINYIKDVIVKNINLEDNHISSIDISEKSVRYGKISFLRYDVYIKLRSPKPLIKNFKFFSKLSEKFDKKLIKLLKKENISCI